MVMLMMSKKATIIEKIAMAILNARIREISPTHPGAVLREDFMPD